MNLKGLALIAVLGGGFVAWKGNADSQHEQKLQKEGKETPGFIDSGTMSKGRRGSKTYKFDIIYTPEGGSKITKNFTVKKPFAEKYLSGDTLVRSDVVIRYLPSDPGDAIVVDGSSSMAGMESIGMYVAGGGAVVFVLSFLAKKKQQTT